MHSSVVAIHKKGCILILYIYEVLYTSTHFNMNEFGEGGFMNSGTSHTHTHIAHACTCTDNSPVRLTVISCDLRGSFFINRRREKTVLLKSYRF